jgi:hypothetical protein
MRRMTTSACTPTTEPEISATSAAFRAVTIAIGAMATAVTLSATATAESGISNGKSYTVTTTSIEGSTPDGKGHWRVQAGQHAEGDPAVVEAFNKASQASARDLIDRARDDAEGLSMTFDADSRVTFRNTAIAESIGGMRVLGTMPMSYGNTIVIDSRTAQPITLANLFSNEQEGLNRLSEQTKKLVPDSGKMMPDEPGNAPVEKNFANWIPTAEGMQISFAPYQFESLGKFNPTITVPWSALTDALAPNMAALAQG